MTTEARRRGLRTRVERGIDASHSGTCALASGGARCSCRPTYQAEVYSPLQGKKIRETFATIDKARQWRTSTRGAFRAKRARDRELLRARREQAAVASQRRAELAAAKRAARAEADLAAFEAERRRTARVAKKLSPDLKATARAYEFARKLADELARAERAEEGVPKIRLRAAVGTAHELEDTVRRAIVGR